MRSNLRLRDRERLEKIRDYAWSRYLRAVDPITTGSPADVCLAVWVELETELNPSGWARDLKATVEAGREDAPAT